MKLLFLDIDGVLTSDKTFINNQFLYSFSPICVQHLNTILQANKVKIILTSTWRNIFSIEQQNKIFNENGVLQLPYDQTPDIGYHNRSDEIKRYLIKRKAEKYAILDDMEIEGFDKNFVRINPKSGLTAQDVVKVNEILSN